MLFSSLFLSYCVCLSPSAWKRHPSFSQEIPPRPRGKADREGVKEQLSRSSHSHFVVEVKLAQHVKAAVSRDCCDALLLSAFKKTHIFDVLRLNWPVHSHQP